MRTEATHHRVEDVEAARRVAVTRLQSATYPQEPPFHPATSYPEYPFREVGGPNEVYDGVRNLLLHLGLDDQSRGSSDWNPLGQLVQPGMTVVVKPNFVISWHPRKQDLFSIITHASVIRAVVDFCWIALKGKGRIIIGDAPQYNCDLAQLISATGVDRVVEFYRGRSNVEVALMDFRRYWSKGKHFPSMKIGLPSDPLGSTRVDLGELSSLRDHQQPQRLYGSVYHRKELIEHHTKGQHIYELSKTLMGADAFISIPKLKVHKKVGVTLNMKGLMGAVTNPNLCVHYTLGSPSSGGDQYPEGLFRPTEESLIKLERWMYDHFLAPQRTELERIHRLLYWGHDKLLKPLGIKVSPEKRTFDAGNWHGNDTAWRMVQDLVRIIYFADSEGRMHPTPQRALFSVIDGVVGGENEGPLDPDPKPSRILLAGESFVAVDLAAARLMGFSPNKLKQFRILEDQRFDFGVRKLSDLHLISDDSRLEDSLTNSEDRCLDFTAHPGWQGQIEI